MENWYRPISDDLDIVDRNIISVLRSGRPELQEMCDYVTSSGGKKIRPAICILSHYICGGTKTEEIRNIATAFEMIHTATLVHDDINDKSEVRRGRITVHKKYTVSKAVILGDFIFAMGFKFIGSAERKIIDTVTEASTAMAESEFIQKEFEHRPAVTEKDYMDIIKGKTAMPISACARAGATLAGADDATVNALASFALSIGTAFQIVDDVLDIIGNSEATGKKIGTDIMEGKPTLPIIYAMADPVSGNKIKEIFKKDEVSEKDLQDALDAIRKTDAAERCLAKAKEMVENAIPMLSELGDPVFRGSLTGLARYIVSRDR